jgi:hypothetical protein
VNVKAPKNFTFSSLLSNKLLANCQPSADL